MQELFDMGDEEYWQEPDFLLALLVSFLANKLDAEFGVTLILRGTVLTGTLVSERAYLSRMNDLFQGLVRGSLASPNPEELRLIDEAFGFDDMTEDVYLDDDQPENAPEDLSFPPIRYLHLRDPYILYPGAAMSFTESPLPILRIRLTEIDGWLPGRVNVVDHGDGDDFSPPFPGKRFTQ
jgi:hypothetical protein